MPIDQQTYDFLRGEWYVAGGPEEYADLAAAIAFAESSGCQYALAGPVDIRPVKTCKWTVTDGENSCGYWQINLRAHPQYSAPQIFDVVTNAEAAVEISNHGADFGPWSTYKDGAYKPYLERFGGKGNPKPPPPPPGQVVGAEDVNTGQEWNTGWQHLTRELAYNLPTALTESHRLGVRTLRRLGSRSRVLR